MKVNLHGLEFDTEKRYIDMFPRVLAISEDGHLLDLTREIKLPKVLASDVIRSIREITIGDAPPKVFTPVIGKLYMFSKNGDDWCFDMLTEFTGKASGTYRTLNDAFMYCRPIPKSFIDGE